MHIGIALLARLFAGREHRVGAVDMALVAARRSPETVARLAGRHSVIPAHSREGAPARQRAQARVHALGLLLIFVVSVLAAASGAIAQMPPPSTTCSGPAQVVKTYSLLNVTATLNGRVFRRTGAPLIALAIQNDYQPYLAGLPKGTSVHVCTTTQVDTWTESRCVDGSLVQTLVSRAPPAGFCVDLTTPR